MHKTFSVRATDLITYGHPSELRPLLRECVASGTIEALSAVKMLARDMYGGIAYNLELKAPAAHSLLAWGGDGLKAITEIALEEPSTENYSLSLQILAAVASGQIPAAMDLWAGDAELVHLVRSNAGDPSVLQPTAKKLLNELIMSIRDPNDIAVYVGVALMGMALTEPTAVGAMFRAMSLRWTAVGLPQLDEYDELLRTPSSDEKALHSFLERNPLFLDPLALRVWSKPDLHGKKEPDFVVQRSDNSYMIVEIEIPNKLLVTAKNQLSADATHAITQVLEYKSFLTERFIEASTTFPNFRMPDGLVVIGREEILSVSQASTLRRENEHRPDIHIIGFDAMARRAHTITRNVIDAPIIVDKARLH